MNPMTISVVNWNVGGVKSLVLPTETERQEFRKDLNLALQRLVERHEPHVIALQEVVEFQRPGEPKISILEPIKGYEYRPTILIDSRRHPHVSKWHLIEAAGKWPVGTYFGQGSALLWRTNLDYFQHIPIWSVPKPDGVLDSGSYVEDVLLASGLYFGSRDTEPRAASVAHFMVTHNLMSPKQRLARPLDVFVVNAHLATLTRERKGEPEVDARAAHIRLDQVDSILSNIVSRYNSWANGGYRFRGSSREPAADEELDRGFPVWLLVGDFNFTPESREYRRVIEANFVDVCPAKGKGTKGSGFGSLATFTADYIFAGPRYWELDPIIGELMRNPSPDYTVTVSDHYPLAAQVPLRYV